jgi:hypothetical protein
MGQQQAKTKRPFYQAFSVPVRFFQITLQTNRLSLDQK